MRALVIMLLLLPAQASAWYCEQVASAWVDQGKILSACGVGHGSDENEARINAFENAKTEFGKVCGEETLCSNRAVNIDPQRSDCQASDKGYTCNRLFYFHITNEKIGLTKSEKDMADRIRGNQEPVVKEVTNIQNITVINNNTLSNPKLKSKDKFSHYVRSVGNVQIYETNHRGHHGGFILRNPSQDQLDRTIKLASKGTANRVYILRD
jgi:hypothetical protein